MKNTDLATSLLILRVLGATFLLLVLRFQLKLFRRPIDADFLTMRRLLFVMVLIAFLGNIVPIVLDGYALTGPIPRALGVLYAVSNAVTALTIAVALFVLYWLADKMLNGPRSKR